MTCRRGRRRKQGRNCGSSCGALPTGMMGDTTAHCIRRRRGGNCCHHFATILQVEFFRSGTMLIPHPHPQQQFDVLGVEPQARTPYTPQCQGCAASCIKHHLANKGSGWGVGAVSSFLLTLQMLRCIMLQMGLCPVMMCQQCKCLNSATVLAHVATDNAPGGQGL